MRSLNLSLAVMSTMLLQGCFGMQQDIVVGDDGNTAVKVALSVDAALVSMGQKNKPDTFCKPADGQAAPVGIAVDWAKGTDKGDITCTMSIKGKTADVFGYLSTGSFMPGTADPKKKKLSMTLSEVKDGKRLEIVIPPDPPAQAKDEKMQSMLIGAVAGRYLQWNVTAPRIIETSGKLSEDGKTASFSVPVAMLISDRQEDIRFTATFSESPPSLADRVLEWIR